MHTINAVENRRMSKHSSANLFRFHELLLVTDKLRGKTPIERRMGHLPYLTSREKEDLAKNKGNHVLLVPKQCAIFFQLVIFLQQNSLLRIQNLIGDGGLR